MTTNRSDYVPNDYKRLTVKKMITDKMTVDEMTWCFCIEGIKAENISIWPTLQFCQSGEASDKKNIILKFLKVQY
jgi:hypothetical protein